MRSVLLLAFGLLAPLEITQAQSLNLGGVDMRVGEDATIAIARLSDTYNLQYQPGLHTWFVSRKNVRPTDNFLWVASVTVGEGLVSSVNKYYDLGNASDLSTVYSTALRDAQRDQAGPCLTSPVRASDQLLCTPVREALQFVHGTYCRPVPSSDVNLTGGLTPRYIYVVTTYGTAMLGTDLKKGSAEFLVLSLLEHERRHGYELNKLIESRSKGVLTFHIASLYPLLYRMEDRGWIAGRWVEKAGERRRRFYAITAAGRHALDEMRHGWRKFAAAVAHVTGVRNG